MKHFNRQENKNNVQCPNPPSNLLSGPPFKDLLSETPLVILQCVSSLSSHSSFVYCSHRVLYTTCCRVTEKKNVSGMIKGFEIFHNSKIWVSLG